MSVAENMAWWRSCLHKEFVGMRTVSWPEPLENQIFVDASTGWGIGLILDDKWLAWQFKEGWQLEGYKIGWAEMVVEQWDVTSQSRDLVDRFRRHVPST